MSRGGEGIGMRDEGLGFLVVGVLMYRIGGLWANVKGGGEGIGMRD